MLRHFPYTFLEIISFILLLECSCKLLSKIFILRAIIHSCNLKCKIKLRKLVKMEGVFDLNYCVEFTGILDSPSIPHFCDCCYKTRSNGRLRVHFTCFELKILINLNAKKEHTAQSIFSTINEPKKKQLKKRTNLRKSTSSSQQVLLRLFI